VTNASQGKQKTLPKPTFPRWRTFLIGRGLGLEKSKPILEKFSNTGFAKNPAPSAKNSSWKKENPVPTEGTNTILLFFSDRLGKEKNPVPLPKSRKERWKTLPQRWEPV
jgi:hypothetical protein